MHFGYGCCNSVAVAVKGSEMRRNVADKRRGEGDRVQDRGECSRGTQSWLMLSQWAFINDCVSLWLASTHDG